MPEDALEQLREFDAVLLGAFGDPSVPDHVSLWGSILPIRQGLDLWANLRPARLLEGVPCPLAGRGPEDIDMLFVRENTEGEYAGVGGIAHRGLDSEVGIETSVFTRARLRARRPSCLRARGAAPWRRHERDEVERLPLRLRALGRGCGAGGGRASGRARTSGCWSTRSPPASCARPPSLDVVVASNLFADILTDLAAAIQGGMGMAASASVAPGVRRAGRVRAGARVGAGHRRTGDRESLRSDLERVAPARASGRAGGGADA